MNPTELANQAQAAAMRALELAEAARRAAEFLAPLRQALDGQAVAA